MIDQLIIPAIRLQQYSITVEIQRGPESDWLEEKKKSLSYIDDLAAAVDSPSLRFALQGDLICLHAEIPPVREILNKTSAIED